MASNSKSTPFNICLWACKSTASLGSCDRRDGVPGKAVALSSSREGRLPAAPAGNASHGMALHICPGCSTQCKGAAWEGAWWPSLPAERDSRTRAKLPGGKQPGKQPVQEKNLVRVTPWSWHSTWVVPWIQIFYCWTSEIGDQATTASNRGTALTQWALKEIKYESLPLSVVVQAFIWGFAVSAGVHKEYMELDMFENMSDGTETHALMDVCSSACFIYLKYSFMRGIWALGSMVIFQKNVFICVNSA